MHNQLANSLEFHGDLQLEPEYTGRGMSKPTAAIVGSQSALYEAIVSLVDDLVNYALDCTSDEEKRKFRADYEELQLNSLSSIRVDDLGTEVIFY